MPEAGLGGPRCGATTATSPDPLWAPFTMTYSTGRAFTGPTSPPLILPPRCRRGSPGTPGSGQYYASPALAALLRNAPADELADRYPRAPGGPAFPGSLVIVVGRSAAQMSHLSRRRPTSTPRRPAFAAVMPPA